MLAGLSLEHTQLRADYACWALVFCMPLRSILGFSLVHWQRTELPCFSFAVLNSIQIGATFQRDAAQRLKKVSLGRKPVITSKPQPAAFSQRIQHIMHV
jgi:hypothetical protein